MNRRTVLLGAGVALTTTIAGCGSADGEDADQPDDPDEMDDSLEDDDADADDDMPADELTEEDEDEDETVDDRIPGFEDESFTVDSDAVSVEEVTRDGETVTVRTEADTLDQNELEAELEVVGRTFVDAIEDTDEFTAAVSTVEWNVEYGGNELANFHIESEWLDAHEAGELSEDELLERILETGSLE
ncbi:hypothetical protein [Natronococcus sp.]|uniref:hypothetical protein n=1 Tax=Natronococcus sp. TaxID=35747 RepID=UPI003A4E3A30